MDHQFNAIQIGLLDHASHLTWLREMDKLVAGLPPYNCEDAEALKRFESILKSSDHRQEVKEGNRTRMRHHEFGTA